jgi:TonB-dependent receptor
MISPNILEGIEVSKTAMADQEADQLGGTVNFMLRGAPSKPTLNATVQGGYNGLRGKASNYYYVLGGGMRFFDNQLGVFAQGNLEKTDRSSNSATSAYDAPVPSNPTIYSNVLNLQDISRTNKRAGGVLVLDYATASTKIKLSNTINNIDVNTFQRQENFDIVGRNHSYQATYSDRSLLTLLNTLNFEQSFEEFKLTGSLSYSKSKTDVPKQVTFSATENNAYQSNWDNRSYQIYPFDIVTKANNNISNSFVNNFTGSNSTTLEEQLSGNLNFEGDFKTDFADIKIKLGGEIKHKYKKYDFEQSQIPLNWQDQALSRAYLADKFGLTGYDIFKPFPYAPFIDNNYDAGDFKSGANYTISHVPDQNTILDAYNDIKNLKSVRGQATGKTLWYEYTTSAQNDYSGHENYYAAYILPTITFGNKIVTFIPGVRYEHSTTEYTANRGSNWGGKATDPLVYFAYTSKKSNDYWLPMLHVKYQVFDWFDVRASYTQTLARPNYNLIIPTWNTSGTSISWNNADLKPAQSKNFDFFLSFYNDDLGLLSVGVFQKQIKDFAFSTQTWIVDSTYLKPEFPASVKPGGTISGYINSPDIAKLWGVEAEWQSNFWFLPGVLKGLVLSVNYTYTNSSLKYPKWTPVYVMQRKGPVIIPVLVGTEDQGYYDRLLDQPTHTFNMTVGFDIADFSIRGSVQFKSNVFQSTNFYQQLRQTTEPLTLWDMKVRQKLPIKGLQVFLNLNNISKAVDQTSNNGTGWFTNRNYYGLTADLGVTYILN